MFSKCPGQDGRNVRVRYYKCPTCGSEVEIFSFDVAVKCRQCGEMVHPEKIPSCIEWCESARRCLGEEKWRQLFGEETESVEVTHDNQDG
jgi:NADH pyrophosphatase NudC (nudix superfamily)